MVCGQDRDLLSFIVVGDEAEDGALNIEVVKTSPFSLLRVREHLSTTYQGPPDHY